MFQAATLSLDLEINPNAPVDALEEIRLRTWARANYAPEHHRDESWHPVILDEMERKEQEMLC